MLRLSASVFRSVVGLALALTAFDPAGARNVPPTTSAPPESKIKSLSDEAILDPKKLVFDRVVPFVDSFDGAPLGEVFISKRSILGNPEVGVIGEKGSPNYMRHCLLFCPSGTSDIDATYVYVIQKKGECSLGVRGIGWAEKEEEWQGDIITGRSVETGRVGYTGVKANISFLMVNGARVSPPVNQSQLTGPHGTNYKYFPRKRNFLGDQTTANEGFITDIHYFPATQLVKAASSGGDIVIDIPNWKPSRHVISGKALSDLKILTAKCDAD
ncbi:MAG: hypothetical protein RLZZ124_945 [Cyanobacteriota bacterium]|jgi:hypothetical protein